MQAIHKDYRGEIRALDDYLYVVCGKLVCFGQDVLDLSDPETAAHLVEFARDIYSDASPIRPCRGSESVCELRLSEARDEIIIDGCCVDDLPEGSRVLARKELERNGR